MSKDREKSLPEKVKQFFFRQDQHKSLGNAAVAPRDIRKLEFSLSPQNIKDFSVQSPMNVRLKTLKDLSEIVVCHRLEDNAIEKLWVNTCDLLTSSHSLEARHVTMHFFSCVIKGQFELIGILRAHFFNFIQNHNVPEDITPRLEMFKILSENGKNIVNFEEEIGIFMLRWMPDIISAGKASQCLPLLINVIKFNAAYLDEEVISGFVMHTCILSSRSSNEEDIKMCLDVLDVIICYSDLPSDSLLYFIEALCRVINYAKFSDGSLNLMQKFLGTHLGHSGIFTMCKILQDRQYSVDFRLLRGAVFFIGMHLWGHKKVPSLKHSPTAVLPSFLCAMRSNNTIVAREIIMSVDRLVRKYGKEVQLLTWELIIDILECEIVHVEENSSEPEVKTVESLLHGTITAIEELHEKEHYRGSIDRLYEVIEKVSKTRPEASVMKLIQYQSRRLYPTQDGWIDNLIQLMERYYKHESRTSIRMKTLDILSSVLCATRYLYEDELIDKVVSVYFSNMNTDPDKLVCNVAVQLLVDLAADYSSKRCFDLLEIINRVISHPAHVAELHKEANDMKTFDMEDLIDVKSGIQGLVEIMQHKVHTLPSTVAITAHKHLISHLMAHYEHPVAFEKASSLRHLIIEYLLRIRANSLRQIGICSQDPGSRATTKVEYSSYLLCATSENVSGARSSSVSQKSAPPYATCTPTYLSMKPTFKAIITCLEKEQDWPVLELALKKLSLVLQNKTFILSSEGTIETLCHSLCKMVSNTGLRVYENLKNQPPKFSRSDFHSFIFPTLAAMSSYNKYLSGNIQRSLVKCLEFGLVSKCASICINALTDCTLEMQDIMYKLLPEVLLSLSKISATTGIASSILEFLSTLIMLPTLYTSFVEDQYMSIFAIALPYTNPFKFNNYIVSLAHHVIAIWFLKCRLPYRRNFVKFITKGLNANIVTPVEDNSEANSRRRSSSLNEAPSIGQQPSAGSRRTSLMPQHTVNKDRASSDNVKLPYDIAMKSFHLELTDTCLDFLARFAFSTSSVLPNRSPLAEFLLKGGQTGAWLLGTTIIVITTSGCGSKVLRQGLCQKCYQLCRKQNNSVADSSEEIIPPQKPSTDMSNRGRRRHQSAAVTSTSMVDSPLLSPSKNVGTKDDSDVQTTRLFSVESSSESSGESRSRQNTTSSSDSNKSNEAILTRSVEEPETQNIDKLLFGADKNSGPENTKESRPQHLCSCWCQGWAEIEIKRPTGNTSWMMRIQNQPHLITSSPSDFPLADLASLFLPSKLDNFSESSFEMYDISGHKRIDSESLGENEYEAIYQEHFESGSPSRKNLTGSEVGMDSSSNQKPTEAIKGEKSANPESSTGKQEKGDVDKEEGKSSLDFEKEPDFPSPTSPKKVSKNDNTSSAVDDSVPIPKSPRKLDRIVTIPEGEVSKGFVANTSPTSANIETIESNTSKLRASSPPMSSRKVKSPPSSPQYRSSQDSSSLQPMLRNRLHTISVMTPAASTSQFPRSTNSLKREIYKNGINPSFVFLQLFHNSYFGNKYERPLIIPKTDAMERALKLLDLIPPYETHKIGVIYVDKDQADDEVAILANEFGSVRYINFLQGIGTLIRFEDMDQKTTYFGGLDLREDGKFTYLWQDDIMQVVFHIATLMPTTKDPCCSNKKRHIGNDYVLIVYNDSGQDFKITTLKGQFIYACVIIEPVDHQSNIVTIKVKPDLVDIIAHEEPKIVSDNNLAIVVRQLALHANLASTIHKTQIATAQNPFASNWLQRLRNIKRLHKKIVDHNAEHENADSSTSRPSPTSMDFTDYV